jgi:hypothetical protein
MSALHSHNKDTSTGELCRLTTDSPQALLLTAQLCILAYQCLLVSTSRKSKRNLLE